MTSKAADKKPKSPTSLPTDQPSREARRVAAAVLEVLAGMRTPTDAASALSVSVPRYYILEQRALAGLVAGCEPRNGRRTKRPETRIAELEHQVQQLQRQCDRHLAVARAAGRSVGLSPLPTTNKQSANKQSANKKKTAKRRRRPAVRALKAARALHAGEEQEASAGSGDNGAHSQQDVPPQGV